MSSVSCALNDYFRRLALDTRNSYNLVISVCFLQDALLTYSYVGAWISLSAGVILYNKYVLVYFGFPFPIALTMIHMAFCSFLAFVIVRVLKLVKGM